MEFSTKKRSSCAVAPPTKLCMRTLLICSVRVLNVRRNMKCLYKHKTGKKAQNPQRQVHKMGLQRIILLRPPETKTDVTLTIAKCLSILRSVFCDFACTKAAACYGLKPHSSEQEHIIFFFFYSNVFGCYFHLMRFTTDDCKLFLNFGAHNILVIISLFKLDLK